MSSKRIAGPEIERLIQLLARLPGLGPRSARRAALHLIKKREALMTPLAGALQEIDRLNLELARRALAVVRGYVEAIQPTPRAYDRYGGRAAAPALAVVSSKG